MQVPLLPPGLALTLILALILTLTHCCPQDGHTTHCFMYNDHDGIAGGVVTCMFSTDRLPPGFKLKQDAMGAVQGALDSESETGEDEAEKENLRH